jgi:dTDP-4-dehydrorhamnose reductase
VGWEIKHYTSLLEWFASQRGQTIKGYRGAIYTGVTTRVLARLVGDLLEHKPDLSGIYHIASQPITKYDLLVRLRNALDWDDIIILPDDTFHCDRSLIGTRFEQATGWQAPTWDTMIAELASERQMYEQWEN